MLVALPSHAIAALEAPSLEAVLGCDGSLEAIAATAWTLDKVDLTELKDGDLLVVAIAALKEFAATEDGMEFFAISLSCGLAPVDELGIVDHKLRWEFNHAAFLALQGRKSAPASPQEHRGPDNEHRATYAVPDDWSGDDDGD